MTAKTILKADPCPFCGTENPMQTHVSELRYLKDNDQESVRTFYIRCFKCDGHGPRALTKEEAIEKWNERVVFIHLSAEDADRVDTILGDLKEMQQDLHSIPLTSPGFREKARYISE